MDRMDMDIVSEGLFTPGLRIPAWAKAEQLERSLPQIVLWHCDPSVSLRGSAPERR